MDVDIAVFESEQYDKDWPSSWDNEVRLTEFIDFLNGLMGTVPVEYQGSVSIAINSALMYEDCHYVNMLVSYTRPETPEEEGQRKSNERRRKAERLAELKRLISDLEREIGDTDEPH